MRSDPRRGAPVQRQLDQETALPLRRPAPGSGRAAPEQTLPDGDQAPGDLDRDVFNRAVSGSNLPLTEPFAKPLGNITSHKSLVQMTVLPHSQVDPLSQEVDETSGAETSEALPPPGILQRSRGSVEPAGPASLTEAISREPLDLLLAKPRVIEVPVAGSLPSEGPTPQTKASSPSVSTQTGQRQPAEKPHGLVIQPPTPVSPTLSGFNSARG